MDNQESHSLSGLSRDIQDIIHLVDLCYTEAISALEAMRKDAIKWDKGDDEEEHSMEEIEAESSVGEPSNLIQIYVDGVWDAKTLKGGRR